MASEITLETVSDRSKAVIRKKVWNDLYDSEELMFPRPPYRQIPNVKGADKAAERLLELEEFKQAENIVVDMDRVLRDVRLKTLEANKTLYVTTSKVPSALVCKIKPPPNSTKFALIQCSNLLLNDFRTVVGPEDHVHLDLMVVSSIAVSRSGLRIGRADDLAELEYAIMSLMGLVNDDTVIVTIVHDLQIDDDIKTEEFTQHDIPVDYIVTPTQILKCEKRTRPANLIWSLLSKSTLDVLTVLRNLRYQEWKKEKDVRLAGETENPTELKEDVVKSNPKRVRNRTSEMIAEKIKEDCLEGKTNSSQKPGRRNVESGVEKTHDKPAPRRYGGRENGDNTSGYDMRNRNNGMPFLRRSRPPFTYRTYGNRRNESRLPAIYIGGLPKQMRSRELLGLLKEQKIEPLRIIKQSFTAYGFVLFEKMESVVDAVRLMENFKIGDRPVKVEVARRTQEFKKTSVKGDVKSSGDAAGDGSDLHAESFEEPQNQRPTNVAPSSEE